MLTYNDQEIQQRSQDNFVNASQMAIANNYRLDNLIERDYFKNYLKALKKSIHLENKGNDKLIDVKGFGTEKATWVHPLVALMIAQNISPAFHVWCNQHIRTLIESGQTSMKNTIYDLDQSNQTIQKLSTIYKDIDQIDILPRLRRGRMSTEKIITFICYFSTTLKWSFPNL